jgi:16S rRNA (guanine(966)-N(2))-methyltransferase RsmD
MRIIAGEFRSRRLKTPKGLEVRPTPDLLRQALFNVLGSRVEGAVFVDAYAGTGAVGLEALSRGAARVVFIEKAAAAVALIRANAAALNVTPRCLIVQGAAAALAARYPADIVFLDPPYPRSGEYRRALEELGRTPPALTVVQHDRRQELREAYGLLRRTRTLTHGDNCLTFYEPASPAQESAER